MDEKEVKYSKNDIEKSIKNLRNQIKKLKKEKSNLELEKRIKKCKTIVNIEIDKYLKELNKK